MADACAFDVTLFDRDTAWCSLFDDEDLLGLEYGDDLDSYYHKGRKARRREGLEEGRKGWRKARRKERREGGRPGG